MAKPKYYFFVITTVFHSSEHIKKTFQSLVSQSEVNFTHYIFDDGSNDLALDSEVANYINNVSKLSSPYEVIYEKSNLNLGCDKAHEHAFKKIEGTHLMWLDAGDWLEPNFFARLNREIGKEPTASWFHINGIHYSKETGTDFGKADFRRFPKKTLLAKNQIPSWVFGNFYYHVFVIQREAFEDLFGGRDIFVIDKAEHGGCFYDAQIVLRLLALRKPMRYVKPLLVHIMADPNSVASNYSGDSELAEKCVQRILNSDPRFLAFSDFYQKYKELVAAVQKTHILCLNSDTISLAQDNINNLSHFLEQKHLSINEYYPNRWKHKLIVFLAHIPFIKRLL